ncbi:MAG TPA: PRC-barrel domain-containing protein [Hyphomicrobiales bacterium]|nr:PRC-barrel domain-containing protein [Hyphomicrobiales bacterium]
MIAAKFLALLAFLSFDPAGLTASAGANLASKASQGQLQKPDPRSPAEKQEETPGEGTTAIIVDANRLGSILGEPVLSASGENIGRIVDVLADRNGQIKAAVIDFGGVLGVGTRKIAIDWSALHFGTKGPNSVVTVGLTRDELRVAPEVKQGEPIVIIGAARPSRTEAKAPEKF